MPIKDHIKVLISYRRRWRFFFSVGFVTILIFYSNLCYAKAAVIQIQYRWASDTLPIVNHFLSPNGKAVVDERTNSLIVIDTEEAITNIKKFLQNYDTPVKRVRIRLRIYESRSSREKDLSVQGSVSGNNWTISVGEANKDGLDVRADESKKQGQQSYEYMITTTSGKAAYILTGKEIPYRERWKYYCRRYAVCSDSISYQNIDTGLEVMPVIIGDRAKLEITPRISQVDTNDPRGVVRFSAASTQLSVPLGQWVKIGGADKQGNDVFSAILSGGSGKQDSSLSMAIMVETY